ncbi:MAG: UMP kinase [Endomicrobium sp.]|jgi:uridylate kinase|nr:UMP kinase [Endomicrobium sp.]
MSSKRVLLKLSGESLSDNFSSISEKSLLKIAREIKSVVDNKNVQLAVVIGAGNIWRGGGKFIERVTADKMGMLATVMNSFALNDSLMKMGVKSIIFSASGVSGFVEKFNIEKAVRCLERGSVVVFAGGTGNPFFTTDTASALRAAEIKADVLLKGTQVDGVYSSDPKRDKTVVKYDVLTFQEALDKRLAIMDSEAFSICREANISIIVFDFYKDGNLAKVISGQKIGTRVEG